MVTTSVGPRDGPYRTLLPGNRAYQCPRRYLAALPPSDTAPVFLPLDMTQTGLDSSECMEASAFAKKYQQTICRVYVASERGPWTYKGLGIMSEIEKNTISCLLHRHYSYCT